MNVTSTSLWRGKFETPFWHKVYEEEVGPVEGQFGPINTIAVLPAGTCYASGGRMDLSGCIISTIRTSRFCYSVRTRPPIALPLDIFSPIQSHVLHLI
ncbi:hypothetical protein B0H11DRAFT_331537 [Mycena galericulata]|nr:hypothetical protein B0H11DRAFT_331537 [Mycena galericulata]